MMLPAVWVPKPAWKYPAAAPAAEPEELPPGVCRGLAGFAVGPGWRVANSVVTVLPRITAPARRASATQAASRRGRARPQPGPPPAGPAPGEGGGAVLRRLVGGIQHVLHAERQPMQRPRRPARFTRGIQCRGLAQGQGRIEPGEGAQDRLAGRDAVEQRLRQCRGGEAAVAEA